MDSLITDWSLDTITVNRDLGQVVYGGQTSLALLACDTEKWQCLMDGNLNFAVPAGWNGAVSTWTKNEVRYEVEQSLSDHTIFLIKAIEPEAPKRTRMYVFSRIRGVLSFTELQKNSDGDLVPVTYMRLDK